MQNYQNNPNHRNEQGAIPMLVLIAVIGVLVFLIVSSFAPFKDKLFSELFPKPSSYARQKGSPKSTPTPTPTSTPSSTSTPSPNVPPFGTYIENSTDGIIVGGDWARRSRSTDWVAVFGQILPLESFSGKAVKVYVSAISDSTTVGQTMDKINNTPGNSIHSFMANIESSSDSATLRQEAQSQYSLAKQKGFSPFIFAPMGWVLRQSNNYQLLADGTTGDTILFQTQGYQPHPSTYASVVQQVVGNIKSLSNHPKVFVQLAVSYKVTSTTFQCFSASAIESFINSLRSGPANTVPDGFVIFYFLADPNASSADAQCTSVGLPTQPNAVKAIMQNYLP